MFHRCDWKGKVGSIALRIFFCFRASSVRACIEFSNCSLKDCNRSSEDSDHSCLLNVEKKRSRQAMANVLDTRVNIRRRMVAKV